MFALRLNPEGIVRFQARFPAEWASHSFLVQNTWEKLLPCAEKLFLCREQLRLRTQDGLLLFTEELPLRADEHAASPNAGLLKEVALRTKEQSASSCAGAAAVAWRSPYARAIIKSSATQVV